MEGLRCHFLCCHVISVVTFLRCQCRRKVAESGFLRHFLDFWIFFCPRPKILRQLYKIFYHFFLSLFFLMIFFVKLSQNFWSRTKKNPKIQKVSQKATFCDLSATLTTQKSDNANQYNDNANHVISVVTFFALSLISVVTFFALSLFELWEVLGGYLRCQCRRKVAESGFLRHFLDFWIFFVRDQKFCDDFKKKIIKKMIEKILALSLFCVVIVPVCVVTFFALSLISVVTFLRCHFLRCHFLNYGRF